MNKIIIIFLVLSQIFLLSSNQNGNWILVHIYGTDGVSHEYIYSHEKRIAWVEDKKVRFIKLDEEDKTRMNIFHTQVEALKQQYGINIPYADIIFEDACIITDILSEYEPKSILDTVRSKDNLKQICIENIDKYYTYLNSKVDFVYSLKINLRGDKIVAFEYIHEPNLTGEVMKDKHYYTYDQFGRMTQVVKLENDKKTEYHITYKTFK
ncbi:MAG: hypothetical protein ACOYJG_10645 [Prevotella sp.]|jgi:hypothetical protein